MRTECSGRCCNFLVCTQIYSTGSPLTDMRSTLKLSADALRSTDLGVNIFFTLERFKNRLISVAKTLTICLDFLKSNVLLLLIILTSPN